MIQEGRSVAALNQPPETDLNYLQAITKSQLEDSIIKYHILFNRIRN